MRKIKARKGISSDRLKFLSPTNTHLYYTYEMLKYKLNIIYKLRNLKMELT